MLLPDSAECLARMPLRSRYQIRRRSTWRLAQLPIFPVAGLPAIIGLLDAETPLSSSSAPTTGGLLVAVASSRGSFPLVSVPARDRIACAAAAVVLVVGTEPRRRNEPRLRGETGLLQRYLQRDGDCPELRRLAIPVSLTVVGQSTLRPDHHEAEDRPNPYDVPQ